MPNQFTFSKNQCPKNVDAFREWMKSQVTNVKGKALISDKFTKDHIFSGHSGSDDQLAVKLAKLRDLPLSTLLIQSMESNAYKEVLNWIKNVPESKLTLNGTTWSISHINSAVPMVNSYKFVTIDLYTYQKMNNDDKIKKSRKYMSTSYKTPKLACKLSDSGIPQIYHLDY